MGEPFLLLYGATGRTGRDIIDGLLRVGGLRIGAITRSTNTNTARDLEALGIELFQLDVSTDSEQHIVDKLKGVDILVSVVAAQAIESQRPLFKAAKAAGVKRVVPSDFSTPTDEGIMSLHDRKLRIHQYIQDLGLDYTWIDVAWWKQLAVPFPPSVDGGVVASLSHRFQFFNDGQQALAVTDRRIIGDFVGRIVKDERTLNQYVFCYEDVTTQDAVWKLAAKSSEGFSIMARQTKVSSEQLEEQVRAAKEAHQADPNDLRKLRDQTSAEYNYSIYIRGDNTPAKAWAQGALDARALYPELEVQSLHDYAEEFYGDPTPFFQAIML